jgi:hypothetical protein
MLSLSKYERSWFDKAHHERLFLRLFNCRSNSDGKTASCRVTNSLCFFSVAIGLFLTDIPPGQFFPLFKAINIRPHGIQVLMCKKEKLLTHHRGKTNRTPARSSPLNTHAWANPRAPMVKRGVIASGNASQSWTTERRSTL